MKHIKALQAAWGYNIVGLGSYGVLWVRCQSLLAFGVTLSLSCSYGSKQNRKEKENEGGSNRQRIYAKILTQAESN